MPGTITVSVRGDMSPLRKELKRVASTPVNLRFDSAPLGRIKGDLGEFEKSLAASNARVLAFGASAGIIMGVQSAFREMVNSALEVEKKLTEVNTVLNTSNTELQRFGSSLFDVARNIPIKTIPQPIKILKVITSSRNILPHRIPNIGKR